MRSSPGVSDLKSQVPENSGEGKSGFLRQSTQSTPLLCVLYDKGQICISAYILSLSLFPLPYERLYAILKQALVFYFLASKDATLGITHLSNTIISRISHHLDRLFLYAF